MEFFVMVSAAIAICWLLTAHSLGAKAKPPTHFYGHIRGRLK